MKNRGALVDAAREYVAENTEVTEAEVQVLEVQRRQGQYVAKYIIDGQPFERYEVLPQEVVDSA